MLSKISHLEKGKYRMISLIMWNLRNKTNKERKKKKQTKNTDS